MTGASPGAIRDRVGAVVIGRNEGERLRICLHSLIAQLGDVVYVDSGSTDGSAELARALGLQVVDLDLTQPFTAARARNAGYARLRSGSPAIAYVQFIDGDCELLPGWLPPAVAFLQAEHTVAVVSGRLYERYPEASLYNRLCDQEWDVPAGEALACGGIALMRVAALDGVGGFRSALIAGEEPELCLRLRRAGWKIWRLNADMALHDADMHRFGQWWLRSVRSGHACAEGAWLHGAGPERYRLRETLRAVGWGLLLPLLVLAGVWQTPLAVFLLLAYPVQVIRIARRRGAGERVNWIYAAFTVLGKFAEAWGVLKFLFRVLLRRKAALIEYK